MMEWKSKHEEKHNEKKDEKKNGIKAIVKKQMELWKERIMKKSKGPFYWKCKEEWGEEEYMNEKGSKKGRIWKTKMRASAVPLQAELYREHRAKSDRCCVCGESAVENQAHMLIECSAYAHERKIMFRHIYAKIEEEKCNKVWSSSEELAVWLLSDEKCDQPIRTFLDAAFTQRSFLLG